MPSSHRYRAVTVRLPSAEDEQLRLAAAQHGLTVSAYLRGCALAAAKGEVNPDLPPPSPNAPPVAPDGSHPGRRPVTKTDRPDRPDMLDSFLLATRDGLKRRVVIQPGALGGYCVGTITLTVSHDQQLTWRTDATDFPDLDTALADAGRRMKGRPSG